MAQRQRQVANDLIFGANLVQTTTSGPGSGFTKRMLTSPDGDIAEDQLVAAIGSYSATAPLIVIRTVDHADGGIPHRLGWRRRAYLGIDSCNARQSLDYLRKPAAVHGDGNLQ